MKEIAAVELDITKVLKTATTDSPLNHRILALDSVIHAVPALRSQQISDVEEALSRYESYHQLLKLALDDPISPAMEQLFGFKLTTDGGSTYELSPSSPLLSYRDGLNLAITATFIKPFTGRYVALRIFKHLKYIDGRINDLREIRPFCTELLFNGLCKRGDTCPLQHKTVSGLEEATRITTRLLCRLVSLCKGTGRLALMNDEIEHVEKVER